MMQKELIETGNSKDYYVLESVLKGNFLLKVNWRRALIDGKEVKSNKINLEDIKGIQSMHHESFLPPMVNGAMDGDENDGA